MVMSWFVPACGRSAIVGEANLEFFAREENAALDRAERQIHLLGDLVVLVTGHMHRERNAVFVGELVDCVGDLVGAERTFGSLETAVLRQVEVVEILSLVDDGCCAARAAVVVDEDVAHYGEHPALEVSVVDILVLVVESLEHGVLKKVVGIVAVGCEHEREVEHVGLKRHETVLELVGSCAS